ncbi:hypothetical protein OSSY52_11140 [Tepiditoga spiralis]|uniref:Uncharacterized protein n=1 Tax=Tepiditoga spiralis TaxID=2108365 RepID=A0A7G1G7U7_9BACT|nr:hypothetical protein OSSY52_00400 [Tepiditoga spiralis]BBE30973.1 hypothetical protein OSSY52_11140 [Tepiditoga spiralis]
MLESVYRAKYFLKGPYHEKSYSISVEKPTRTNKYVKIYYKKGW